MSWWPPQLSKEAEREGYIYFDQNIRPLPKKPDGTIDTMRPGFQDNDVDAFRHAYVSGIMTHEYGENAARFLGWMNELTGASGGNDRNMDFWNNAVGRELAIKHRSKEALAKAINDALESGRLIFSISDERVYEGVENTRPAADASVIVLKENFTGANEMFFDLNNSRTMTRDEFVVAIDGGQYPGYTIRTIGGVKFPISKRDESSTNNLG